MKIPENPIKSRSKVFMELKAIICIDKCHFVAYVKQIEKDNKSQWYFFDSMSTQSLSSKFSLQMFLTFPNIKVLIIFIDLWYNGKPITEHVMEVNLIFLSKGFILYFMITFG